MRILISILFTLTANIGFAQVDSTTHEFLNEVIRRRQDTSAIFYTNRVDPGMYWYMMKELSIKRKMEGIGGLTNEKLSLTREEVTFLKGSLTNANDRTWADSLFANSRRISTDSLHSFLKRNRNQDLYLFSQPVFIRNGTIALFYVARLCCGGIYGPDDLSFYRKGANGWQRWITIQQGAF